MLEPVTAAPEPRRHLPTAALALVAIVAIVAVAGISRAIAPAGLSAGSATAQIDLPGPSELDAPDPSPTATRPTRDSPVVRPWPQDLLATPEIVCAHDPDTCIVWSHQYPQHDPHRHRPVEVLHEPEHVLILDGGELRALHLDDARLLWASRLPRPGGGDEWQQLRPFPEIGVVLVQDGLHAMYAFDLDDGALLWQRDDLGIENVEVEPARAWVFDDELRIAVTPIDPLDDDAGTRLETVLPRTGEVLRTEQVSAASGDAEGEAVLADELLAYTRAGDTEPAWTRRVARSPFGGAWMWLSAEILELGTGDLYLRLLREDGSPLTEPGEAGFPSAQDQAMVWWHSMGDRQISLRASPKADAPLLLSVREGGEVVLEHEVPRHVRDCCVDVAGDTLVIWHQFDDGVRVELLDVGTGWSRTLFLYADSIHVPWWGDSDEAPTYLLAQGRNGTTAIHLASGSVAWRSSHTAIWPVDEDGELFTWPGGILRLRLPPD